MRKLKSFLFHDRSTLKDRVARLCDEAKDLLANPEDYHTSMILRSTVNDNAHVLVTEDDTDDLLAVIRRLCDLQDPDEVIEKKDARIRELEDLLRPFATFAEKFDAQPLRNTSDAIYGIHQGTVWEADLRISDCRSARDALKNSEARG